MMLKEFSGLALLAGIVLLLHSGCSDSRYKEVVQTGHVAPVDWLKFSPDGQYLLTRTKTSEDILWDAQAGVQLRTLHEHRIEPYSKRWACDMSPDGKTLLVGCHNKTGPDEVLLQSTATGCTLHRLELKKELSASQPVYFSCDGRYVAMLSSLPYYHVWDAETGKLVYEPNMLPPYSEKEFLRLEKELEKFEIAKGLNAAETLKSILFLKTVRPDGKPLFLAKTMYPKNSKELIFVPNSDLVIARVFDELDSYGPNDIAVWDVKQSLPISYPRKESSPSELFDDASGHRQKVRGVGMKTIELVNAKTSKVIRSFQGHKAKITKLAIAPNGKNMLSGDEAGTVILWDLLSSKKVATIPKATWDVTVMQYDSDGKQFLVRHDLPGSRAKLGKLPKVRRHIGVYDAATGKERFSILGHEIYGLDNNRARSLYETTVRDSNGKERVLKLGTRNPSKIDISPNGRWAFCRPGLNLAQHDKPTGPNLPAVVWDVQTGKQILSFAYPEQYYYRYENRPDPKTQAPSTLTSENFNEKQFLRYGWKGKRLGFLARHVGGIIENHEKLDEESKQWLLGFLDAKGKRPKFKRTLFHASLSPSISPGGHLIAARGGSRNENVDLWTRDGKLQHSLKAEAPWRPTAVTFNQEGSKLLVGYSGTEEKRQLILWDTETGQQIKTTSAPDAENRLRISSITLSPNERYATIAISSGYLIYLVDLETGESDRMTDHRGESHSNVPALFSPHSKRVYCFGQRRTLWDIEKKKTLADFGAYNSTHSPLFSPNGKIFLVCSREHGAAIWDAETGKKIHRFGEQYCLRPPLFSPDGTRLIPFGLSNKPLELWDFQSGEKLTELSLEAEAGSHRNAFFMPDAKRIVTTYKHGLAIWDAESGKLLISFVDKTEPLTSRVDLSKRLLFEPRGNLQPPPFFINDGKWLVITHRNGATLWDVDTGKLLHRFLIPYLLQQPEMVPHFPCKETAEVVLSSDQKQILVALRGRQATIWDIVTGEPIQTFSPLRPDTEKSWFSKDGTQIFSRHHNGQIVIRWDVATGKEDAKYYVLDNGKKWLTLDLQTGQAIGATEFLRMVP